MSKFSYLVRYDYKKFGQPFQKLWVWAKATILSANEIFSVAKQPAVRRLERNGKKLLIANANNRTVFYTVRLFARGLDKEMGMSGTDAFAPSC